MTRREFLPLLACAVRLGAQTLPANSAGVANGSPLRAGFRLLYHLRFPEARSNFQTWQHDHLADPMGFTAEAASHLFEEFEHHGVLTSEFFLDDERFLGGITGIPNAARTQAFEAATKKAQDLAEQMLRRDRTDANALLALTMCAGMRSDYASLISKHQIEGLSQLRQAESFGKRLLTAAPGTGDGYMALGAASYVIACLPFYKRAVLFVGGMQGNKQRGLEQLELAARTGIYLAPFAKMLLALALLRESNKDRARKLLAELTEEFPSSPLFARERGKLEQRAAR